MYNLPILNKTNSFNNRLKKTNTFYRNTSRNARSIENKAYIEEIENYRIENENLKNEIEKLIKEKEELQNIIDNKENEIIYNKKVYNKNINEKKKIIERLEKDINNLKESNNEYKKNLRNEVYMKLDEHIKQNEKEKAIIMEELMEEKEKETKFNEEHDKIKNEYNQLKQEYNELNDKYNKKLEQNINDINDDINSIIINYKNQIEKQELKLESNSEEINNLYNENLSLKKLAKVIIEQRNETEIFFIDALDEVKKELYNRTKDISIRGNFFPTLKKKYDKEDVKVDIKSLSPESKEQVLIKLFSKINESYDPDKYKQLDYIMNSNIDNEIYDI